MANPRKLSRKRYLIARLLCRLLFCVFFRKWGTFVRLGSPPLPDIHQKFFEADRAGLLLAVLTRLYIRGAIRPRRFCVCLHGFILPRHPQKRSAHCAFPRPCHFAGARRGNFICIFPFQLIIPQPLVGKTTHCQTELLCARHRRRVRVGDWRVVHIPAKLVAITQVDQPPPGLRVNCAHPKSPASREFRQHHNIACRHGLQREVTPSSRH